MVQQHQHLSRAVIGRPAPARGRCGRVLLLLALAVQCSLSAAAPADCAALQDDYRSALQEAQHCDTKTPKSCGGLRAVSLEDACHCQVSVNPKRTARLDRLQAEYRAKGCAAQPAFCNRMCTAPDRTCGAVEGAQPSCGRH